MYLDHFKLDKLPFLLTPDTHFYCELDTHQNVLKRLISSLQQGEGVMKVIGKMGTGKTLLCQLLPKALNNHFIIMPASAVQNERELYELLARKLDLSFEMECTTPFMPELIDTRIVPRLLELKKDKAPILLIDESHYFSNNCLKAIYRLSNLQFENKPLLQIVFFGQPELDKKLKKSTLRELRQSIQTSCYLKKLDKKEREQYICHRLTQAGADNVALFSPSAKKRLIKACAGLPSLLNILCHKALLISYAQGLNQVDHRSMKRAILDTESVLSTRHLNSANIILTATTTVCLIIIFIVYRRAGLI